MPATETDADSGDSADSSTTSTTVILTFDVVEDDEVEGNVLLVDGSLTTFGSNGDNDDRWYDPLTLTQLVAILVGIGVLILGTVLVTLVFLWRHKRLNIASIAPSSPGGSLSTDDKLMTKEGHKSGEVIPFDNSGPSKPAPLALPTSRYELALRSKSGKGLHLAADSDPVFELAR